MFVPVQATQLPPLLPHATTELPVRQAPAASRQPPQVPPAQTPCALQVAPPLAEQSLQLMPPEPHAVSVVAVWQTPAFVQVAQVVSLQTPALQVAAPWQAEQVAPALPHAAVTLPAWQAPLASQQPAHDWAQVWVEPPPVPVPPPLPLPPPVPPPTQALAVQLWPVGQATHDLPMLPQVAFVDPL